MIRRRKLYELIQNSFSVPYREAGRRSNRAFHVVFAKAASIELQTRDVLGASVHDMALLLSAASTIVPTKELSAFRSGDIERRQAVVRRLVHRRARAQQQLHALLLALLRGDVERRPAVVVRLVHRRARAQQLLHALLLALLRGDV